MMEVDASPSTDVELKPPAIKDTPCNGLKPLVENKIETCEILDLSDDENDAPILNLPFSPSNNIAKKAVNVNSTIDLDIDGLEDINSIESIDGDVNGKEVDDIDIFAAEFLKDMSNGPADGVGDDIDQEEKLLSSPKSNSKMNEDEVKEPKVKADEALETETKTAKIVEDLEKNVDDDKNNEVEPMEIDEELSATKDDNDIVDISSSSESIETKDLKLDDEEINETTENIDDLEELEEDLLLAEDLDEDKPNDDILTEEDIMAVSEEADQEKQEEVEEKPEEKPEEVKEKPEEDKEKLVKSKEKLGEIEKISGEVEEKSEEVEEKPEEVKGTPEENKEKTAGDKEELVEINAKQIVDKEKPATIKNTESLSKEPDEAKQDSMKTSESITAETNDVDSLLSQISDAIDDKTDEAEESKDGGGKCEAEPSKEANNIDDTKSLECDLECIESDEAEESKEDGGKCEAEPSKEANKPDGTKSLDCDLECIESDEAEEPKEGGGICEVEPSKEANELDGTKSLECDLECIESDEDEEPMKDGGKCEAEPSKGANKLEDTKSLECNLECIESEEDDDVVLIDSSAEITEKPVEESPKPTEAIAKKSEVIAEKMTEESAEKMEESAEKIEEIADKAEEIAEKVEDTAEKMEDIAEKVEDIAEKVGDIAEKMKDVTDKTEDTAEKSEVKSETAKNDIKDDTAEKPTEAETKEKDTKKPQITEEKPAIESDDDDVVVLLDDDSESQKAGEDSSKTSEPVKPVVTEKKNEDDKTKAEKSETVKSETIKPEAKKDDESEDVVILDGDDKIEDSALAETVGDTEASATTAAKPSTEVELADSEILKMDNSDNARDADESNVTQENGGNDTEEPSANDADNLLEEVASPRQSHSADPFDEEDKVKHSDSESNDFSQDISKKSSVDGEQSGYNSIEAIDEITLKPAVITSETASVDDDKKSMKRSLSVELPEQDQKKFKQSSDEHQQQPDAAASKPGKRIELKPKVDINLDFLKRFKKSINKMTKVDLEELVLQKIVETIIHRSELADMRELIEKQEKLIGVHRTKITEITKQFRDLEMVHSRVVKDLEQKNQQFIMPVKITRAVGLQVLIPKRNEHQQVTPPTRTTTTTAPINTPQVNNVANASNESRPVPNDSIKRRAVEAAPQPEPSKRIRCNQKVTPLRPDTLQRPTLLNSANNNPTPSNNTVNYQLNTNNKVSPVFKTVVRAMPSQPGTPNVTQTTSVQTGNPQQITQFHVLNHAVRKSTTMRPSPQQMQPAPQRPAINNFQTSPDRPRVPPMILKKTANGRPVPTAASPQTAAPTPQAANNTPVAQVATANKSIIDLTDEDEKPSGPQTVVVPASQAPNRVTTYVISKSNNTPPRVVTTPNGNARTVQRSGYVPIAPKQPGAAPAATGNIRPQIVQASPAAVPQRRIATPAPLPKPPFVPNNPSWKAPPPRPTIRINNIDTGIVISWTMDELNDSHAEITSYQIYAYQETSAPPQPQSDSWRHVGDVKAMLLPMAVTLTQFQEGQRYFFAVRAVDTHGRVGHFSMPKTW